MPEPADVVFNWAYDLRRAALVGLYVFSEIVPDLKRLGLLTLRVREAFAKIGVLHFENLPDSTQDETVQLPPMVADFLAGMARANPSAG